jgi:hypothetical protein
MVMSIRSLWRSMGRQALVIAAVAVIVLLVAWRLGAFESRVSYWIERGQDCGQVDTGPMAVHIDRSGVEQAITCFVAAYARCRPAVLTQTVRGVDTSDTDTFVIEPNNGTGCDVGLHSSFYMASGNTTTVDEAQCAGMTSTNGELTIRGCQGVGDFTLAAVTLLWSRISDIIHTPLQANDYTYTF